MKMTFTDLKNQYLRNIGKAGSVDTNILADFASNLGQRYQLVMAKMQNYKTQTDQTASTTASQQYYQYPPGTVSLDTCTITVGSVKYVLNPIYSQHAWDTLNSLQIQPSAIPQFVFPRASDFGIWPIPQDTYTITFNYFFRDRNLMVDDYTGGTVTVVQNSSTVIGTGVFTQAMIGRYFEITDTTQPGQGYWYRVLSVTSDTILTLETVFEGNSGSGLSYRIGEVPLVPDEGHIILADGPTADFYAGLRDDQTIAQSWENKFWTGDRTNSQRDTGDENIAAGLIGLMNRYASRDKKRLIQKQPQPFLPQYKVWSSVIS